MPEKLDGPAGRNEVSQNYRDNYDRVFKGTSLLCDWSDHPDFDNCTKCKYACRSMLHKPCSTCLDIHDVRDRSVNNWSPKKSTTDGGN